MKLFRGRGSIFFIRDEIGNTRKNDAKQIPRLIMESALSVREKLFSIRIL